MGGRAARERPRAAWVTGAHSRRYSVTVISSQPPTPRATVESGARAAALALGRMLRRPGMAGDVDEPDRATLASRLGERAVAVSFTVTGAQPARFAALIAEHDALALSRHLVKDAGAALGARETAALAELGNIAASAFLNGVAALLHGSCVPSVPELVHDSVTLVLADALGADEGALWVARIDVDQRAVWLAWIASP